MIQLQLSDRTEQSLKQIILLPTDKDIFFTKIIDYQISELKLGLYNIEKDLKQFETGKIGDEDDSMIWSRIYEMYLRDNEKLEKLQW